MKQNSSFIQGSGVCFKLKNVSLVLENPLMHRLVSVQDLGCSSIKSDWARSVAQRTADRPGHSGRFWCCVGAVEAEVGLENL